MASSGIRTPTFFLAAYLAAAVPHLIHCLGSALFAVRMKVYCCKEALLKIKFISSKKPDEPTELHPHKSFMYAEQARVLVSSSLN